MNAEPIIIERSYKAPTQRVWDALTNPVKMKEWYFDVHDFKPEVGCRFRFTAGPDGRPYVHLCEVTEVVPGRKIAYSWKFQGYEGNSHVSFELFAEGDTTRLRLTHTGIDTFPPLEDFKRSNFNEGWNSILGTSLKNFVEKQPEEAHA